MRIGQIWWQGRLTAAVFENNHARPVPGYSLRELVDRGERDGVSLADLAARYAVRQQERIDPALPIEPREVWACGCTFEMSAAFRDAEHGTREGFYRHVFTAPRPEIFFKGTARVCAGPGQRVGIREDSRFTAPEPELAVLLGAKGRVLGYTLANDVSAWDIERENPLYLPQSKIYSACCSLGPWFVTPNELTDPYSLDIRCVIERNGQALFDGSTSTSKLGRRIDELVEYLLRANPVPAGSVLLTGTGIVATETAALAEGDTVRIECPQIGTLVNGTMIVK